MCFAIYIGSNTPIMETGLHDDLYLYISSQEDQFHIIKHLFTKKYLYYVGSFRGCACGFSFNDDELKLGLEHLEKDNIYSKKSVNELIRVLEAALENEENIELLYTWGGSVVSPLIKEINLAPQELLSYKFPLKDGDFVIFNNQ